MPPGEEEDVDNCQTPDGGAEDGVPGGSFLLGFFFIVC